jgi:cytoskeleton protein RodZ
METQMNQDNAENNVNNPAVPTGDSKPGAFLAAEREKRGISIDYIASKLNLRTQVLLHLEADDYEALPNPVFIKGYIRGYCKHLDIQADPLIEAYNQICPKEIKVEKAVWQTQPQEEKNEKWLQWMAAGFAVVAVVSVSMWWFENKSNESIIPAQWRQTAQQESQAAVHEQAAASDSTDVKLSDLSKMRQLLTANNTEEKTTAVSAPDANADKSKEETTISTENNEVSTEKAPAAE